MVVAGSGPTDRNWSNPLLPASYGGRDFAGWLQKQGIGSLRYDKRFIGSKDPALDISLDAQVGDIRGALAAARAPGYSARAPGWAGASGTAWDLLHQDAVAGSLVAFTFR